MPDNEKLEVVECPYCGAQYLPVEIFIPDAVFGRPTHIDKDARTHRIIDVLGYCGNNVEHYICDYCNKPFRVTMRAQYTSKREDKFDFDEEYATRLKKNTLFMNED